MKRKVQFSFVLLFVFLLFLTGCASNRSKDVDHYDGSDNVEEVINETNESTPERKIIYKVNMDLTTENLSESISKIKKELNSDEWLDLEDITNNNAYLVIRVKSAHLEDFLNSIKEGHDVSNFNKTATDISLTYQDKSNLILSYEKERERLLVLYEEASLSDMLVINKRLSEIEIEIGKLQGELNQFDSLVDYSEVKLNIYLVTKESEPKSLSFGDKIENGFLGGFKGLLVFLEALLIVFVTLLPWMIVIAPVSYIIYRIRKHNKKTKQQNNFNNPNNNYPKDRE